MEKKTELSPFISIAVIGTLIICGLFYNQHQALFSRSFSSPLASLKKTSLKQRLLRKQSLGSSKVISQKGLIETSVLLSDPAMSEKWGLQKSDVKRAWSVSQGNDKIIVAVIDTGIDINHEDLKKNLWRNPGESGLDRKGRNKSTNGIDDDGNGYIDDLHGWNFVSNNNNLKDTHGHGTHISGIIGAQGGNGKGVSGVSPKVKIMTLKYYDPRFPQTDNLSNTISAINYIIKMSRILKAQGHKERIRIINYSGGGLEYSAAEFNAIETARKEGILFVAAAGNEKSNSDLHKYYPADYSLDNIISVTALNPSLKVLKSSNYGIETVDIAAPGENILSTLPNSQYGYMTGTSQATSFVAGGAVLVMSRFPHFSSAEVSKYLLQTGDRSKELLAKTGTSRKLNLFKALVTLDKGVSRNGIIASNTQSMEQGKFASDGSSAVKKTNSSTANASSFGQELLKALPSAEK